MVTLGIYIMYDIADLIVVWYILSHCVTSLYYKLMGARHWYIALLPAGTTIVVQLDLSAMPIRWSVLHFLFIGMALFAPFPMFFLYRSFILLRDCLYNLAVSECEWYKWGCIPLYRYMYMVRYIIKEVKQNASNTTR